MGLQCCHTSDQVSNGPSERGNGVWVWGFGVVTAVLCTSGKVSLLLLSCNSQCSGNQMFANWPCKLTHSVSLSSLQITLFTGIGGVLFLDVFMFC